MAELSGNGLIGRKVRAYKGDKATGTAFIARSKTLPMGSEPIDVTGDTDDGFRTYLSDPAQRQIDLSIEGVLRQDDFIKQFLNPDNTAFLEQYTLDFPGIGEVTGDFFLANFEVGANYNEGSSFTTSLQSSGKWTFTAAT